MGYLKKMFLNINGVDRILVCDPEKDNLAMVLRRLGLTGTKVGCGTGQCGACTVILDGKVTRACVKKMKAVPEYAEIITIEGIGTPQNLHPIQLAWIVYGGVQCGFCTPGFIVSAYGLLTENLSPTREEVRAWFQKHRNACRCTGYKPLVDATMAAAEVMRGEKTMADLEFKIPEDGRIYNTHYPRPAALSKVTGLCDFGADINDKLPDGYALHLAVVQAGVSHARVISIDSAEAEQMPGVEKIITHKDVKGTNHIVLPPGIPVAKTDGTERPILVEDTIFRYGDVCALVAADTREHAREAAKKVKVNYEQLPEYMNALDSMAEDAMEIHKGTPNIYFELPVIKGGDTEEIMEKAPYVVEGSFRTQRQPHLVIEPDVSLGYFDEEGRLTLHCKSLALNATLTAMCPGIGLKPNQVRLIENPTGASFGYAISPSDTALTAVATMATGRPCCLQFSYAEHNHFTGKRAPGFTNLKIAANEEGKIQAIEFDIAYDKGSYSEVCRVITKGIRFMCAPYVIPNAIGLSKAVCTNHCFTTSFRSFGSPQIYPASEQLMDELAEKMGMDPLELRYKNVYRDGDETLNGHVLDVYPMVEILDRLRPKYQAALERAKAEDTPEKRRGVGIACGMYNVTAGPNDHSEVALELNPDGTVTHFNTWEDQGQGGDIGTLVHTHECLRPLGLTPEQIKLVQNDTALCPASGPAAGSRSNYMNGNATIDAANKLLGAMKKEDGAFRTYEEMVAEGIPTKYIGIADTSGITEDLNWNNGQGKHTAEFTYGVFMSEVEVDVATGKTKVLGMTVIGDIGVVSSRQAADGQAYGGLAQGIGLALSENYDDVMKHTSLVACGFPFIDDVPDNLDIDYVESHRPTGPHGSVGCSELYLSAPHAAVLNAIHHATGVRIYELPATPDKVKAGIETLARGEKIAMKKYYLGCDLHERIDEIKRNPIFVLK